MHHLCKSTIIVKQISLNIINELKMDNQSYFKTVSSIASQENNPLSKPLKSNNKPLTENDLALYQAARDKCANKFNEKHSTPLY